jgi:protein TonB
MKNLLITFLLISTSAFSQDMSDTIYKTSEVDSEPQFIDGTKALYVFISKTYRVPKIKKDTKVVIEFVVENNGALTNMKIIEDPGKGFGEEFIRTMNMSPEWKPGMKDGIPVRTLYSVPLTLRKGD